MCDACKADPESAPVPTSRRRPKLWELKGGMHCSIIGTCLSHEDLLALARRTRADVTANSPQHEVHGFFVGEAVKDSPISRAIAKLLDQRFEGIIRKASRCTCGHSLRALWRSERDAGRIAGAFWALMSAADLTDALRAEVFGEVHMLSHLQGHSARTFAIRASDLDAKVAALEERLTREQSRHADALAERDDELARLRTQRCEAVSRDMLRPPVAASPPSRDERRDLHRARALAAARERARTAETEAAMLREKLQRLELLVSAQASADAAACPAAKVCDAAVEADKRRVLYLGGRQSAMEQLRAIATGANAEFLHHDGGIEQAAVRIDGLIEGCDAVFCPIDCVSHAACLRAKALCRKHNKPFVPLRSSGVTTFARALEQFSA